MRGAVGSVLLRRPISLTIPLLVVTVWEVGLYHPAHDQFHIESISNFPEVSEV